MNDRVSITIENHVADVRLNRPDKMNALDPAMFDGIIGAIDRLEKEPGVRAVVLSGEGRSFCAGLDMASFTAPAGGSDGSAPSKLTDRPYGNANKFQQVAFGWRKLPMPVIAAVHGVCFGGGAASGDGGGDARNHARMTRLSAKRRRRHVRRVGLE